jgi:cytolysin (calcineurin-like family phosphatase)
MKSAGCMHGRVQSETTFTGRKIVAPDYPYAPFNEDGTENTRWKNLVEMLTELVADESRPADERGRAAEILKYYAEYVKHTAEHHRPEASQEEIELDIRVAVMLGEFGVGLMWFNPDDVWFQTATAKDGTTHQVVVSKKYHGPQAHS